MKRLILNTLMRTGLFTACRLANRRRSLIITYHRFASQKRQDRTPATEFVAQLNYLRNRYSMVPFSALVEQLGRGRKTDRPLAAITIDDGYEDAYEVAF